jgi:hypothetical protein
MAAELHFLDQRRLIDSNGIAAASDIYFYQTGTLTPATVYTDEGLTTPHPSPITVDAGAAVPDIYLDSDVTYRRRIVYSDGSVDDTDPALPLSTSSMIFAPGLTGSVSRTAQTKLREIVSVDDFGAVGDGVTNDAAAIALAIANTPAGGVLRLTPGKTYFSSTTVTFDADNLTVEGTGATITTTADNQAVNFAGASLKIRGVHFDLAATGADPAPYLEFNGADTVFEDNTVTRSAAAHIPCYVRSTATGLRFRNNHCTWYGGINMISNCKDIEITGNSFINPGAASDDGIAIKAVGGISENILIADNYFENMADFVGIGSEIGATAATDSTYSNIARAITITGNRGKNCTRMLMVKPGGVDGVDVRDGTVRGVTFSNNTLIDESGTAMLQPILIQPGRGARVFDVTGKNNKAIGRCTTGDQVGYYIFLRNDGTGTADVVVDNIDIGIEIIDRYGGVASGGSAPG